MKNGQTGKLALGADISVQQTNAALQAKLTGNFTLALTADLKPASIKGSTRLDVTKAEGALADAAAFGSELNVEVTPTDIKEVALRFQKGNANLGELRVSGPFDMQKLEGRLSIVLAGIDKQLLNLAGAKSGMDFGSTTISSTNDVELAKGGSVITANGQFDVNNFQLTRTNQTTPRLDLRKEYDVTVDREQSAATLRSLTVTGTQNGKTLLKAELTSPMQISWGNASNAVGDSALTLTVTELQPRGLEALPGRRRAGGHGEHDGESPVAARRPASDAELRLADRPPDRERRQQSHLRRDDHLARRRGKATDLKQFNLTDYKLEVAHQNETLTTVSGSGTYDKASEAADMQVAVQAALAPLLQTVPQPDMSISSGTVELKAHLTQKQKTQAVTGNLALADFSGRFGTNEVRSLGTTVDFDVGMASQQVQIRKLTGKLTQKQKAQAVTGSLALTDFSGRFGTNEVRSLGTAVDFDVGMASQQVQIRKLAGKLTQGANAPAVSMCPGPTIPAPRTRTCKSRPSWRWRRCSRPCRNRT